MKPIHLRGMEDQITEPPLVYQEANDLYNFNIGPVLSKETIKVYAGLSPVQFEEEKPLIETQESYFQLPPLDEAQRYYFKICPENSPNLILAERHLELSGTSNFRDIGGYMTQDKRQVKWGIFYRSDHIYGFKSKDWNYIQSLQIKTIFDLRGPEEIKSKPYTLPNDLETERKPIPIFDPTQSLRDVIKMIRKANPNTFQGDQFMINGYQQFISNFKDSFAQLLQEVSQPQNTPSLIHCTGGKDRTGFAVALLLSILGVPYDTIKQDYLASNYYRYYENLRIARQAALFRISPRVLVPILEVREAYLQAAWQGITQNYDSIDQYLEQELGIKSDTLEKMRNNYLY